MIGPLASLSVLAEVTSQKIFEFGSIHTNADWIAPILVLLAMSAFVIWMYILDAAELPWPVACLLTFLRIVVFVALLLIYLQPQWRTETQEENPSRVLVMVDTTLSMGLTDNDAPLDEDPAVDAGEPGSSDGAGESRPTIGNLRKSRIKQVTDALNQSTLIETLRQRHEVHVVPFGESLARDRGVTFRRIGDNKEEEGASDGGAAEAAQGEDDSGADSAIEGGEKDISSEKVDFAEALAPRDTATAMGLSIEEAVEQFRGTPISGILLVSDGGQNAAHTTPIAAAKLAADAKIPIYTVAIGSDELPINVRMADINAPPRAYPGDNFKITGYLHATRMAGQVVDVALLARDGSIADSPQSVGTGQLIDAKQVTLVAEGATSVTFEVDADRIGRRTFCVKVRPLRNDANAEDNFQETEVEIIDRENRVMMIAGGPMREYRFLRTQLFRDQSIKLDVWLQSSLPGMSQEADELLDDFPVTREEMFKYDCIVAFDPDWTRLSVQQIELLEEWVAEQGGGIVAVAGPVFNGKMVDGWADPRTAETEKIRALYPVEFPRYDPLGTGVYVAKEPWPIEFTRAGLEAEYLWPADTAIESNQAWKDFSGVFSYRPVGGAKPGARVLARYSDPRTARDGEQPVYMAEQFYGSGRVFYMGSGEMWRIRKLDPNYFVQFYTKVIRHVSQGRLLRGSSRGVLLIEKQRYVLGATVEVRAQLVDSRHAPLEMDEVTLDVIRPNGSLMPVMMKADTSRPGAFTGRFGALIPGNYQLELPVPDSTDVRLTGRIMVRIPDLERENPQRNDRLLQQIAKTTGGKFYIGATALTGDSLDAPVAWFEDKTRTIVKTEFPDFWKQDWLHWLIYILCGLLFIEWIIRRLAKLA